MFFLVLRVLLWPSLREVRLAAAVSTTFTYAHTQVTDFDVTVKCAMYHAQFSVKPSGFQQPSGPFSLFIS